MKQSCFFLLLATLLAPMQVKAQNRYDWSQKKYTITIQPLQIVLRNSLRLDFEVRLADGPGWLQFGPAFYYAERESDHLYVGEYRYHYWYQDNFAFNEPFTKLFGGGMDVNYKLFLNDHRSIYFLSGLSFTRLNISYWGSEWGDFEEDGLSYSWYQHTKELCQRINRTGANLLFGFQVPSRHLFLFDMFGGFSYRYSTSQKNKPSFGENAFSYGYTGWVFVTGFRVGIGIK